MRAHVSGEWWLQLWWGKEMEARGWGLHEPWKEGSHELHWTQEGKEREIRHFLRSLGHIYVTCQYK